MPQYTPRPIDTAAIVLDSDIAALVERLAANAHDVWAERRLADGWHYDRERDDDAKTHPCLVPYGDLSEGEKSYDRAMVEQAIKSALVLGWRLEKPRRV